MDPSTWRYLKVEIDRRKRARIKRSRAGSRCVGCGGVYSRYTPNCLVCARRKKARKRIRDLKRG